MAMTAEPLATIRIARRFSASPERVFDAWVDRETVRQWMLAPAAGEMVRIDIDARAGGSFRFVARRRGEEIEHVGDYLAFDRPRRLVFSWMVPRFSKDATRVAIDLVPAGSGTDLTLAHEGVPQDYKSRTEQGWTAILDAIAAALAP
jgi:uncharacterized protein YndB with AHSA1/START domain